MQTTGLIRHQGSREKYKEANKGRKGQIKGQRVQIAKNIDLDVLIEVHSEKNFIKFINKKKVLLGVNNRNLKNMVVDVNHALKVVKKNNKNYIICESGIKTFQQYQNLISQGFKNFLIGEYFMKSKDTKKELLKFTNEPLKIESY